MEDKDAGQTPRTGAHRRKALLLREARRITTLTRDFFEKPLRFYMKALTSSSEMDSTTEFSLPVPRLSDLWMSQPVPLASANPQGRASILCCVLPPLHPINGDDNSYSWWGPHRMPSRRSGFPPSHPVRWLLLYSHFAEEETEAQRSLVTCPNSHCKAWAPIQV